MSLKNHIPLVISGLIAMFLYGCAVTGVVMLPEYAGKKFSNVSLVVEIRDKEPTINYQDSAAPELGTGDKQKLIIDFFKKQLINDIRDQNDFSSIAFDLRIKELPHTQEMVDTKEGQFYFDIPVSGAYLEFGNSRPDFVLIIEELSIASTVSSGFAGPALTGSGVSVTGSGPLKGLMIKSKFIIRDNRAKKTVSYGYVVGATSESVPAITVNEWLWAIEAYVSKIFLGTPFRK
jgi:hypothetical protein